jgi:hypothetical protein
MSWLFRDPSPDPELGSALRQLERASSRDDAELRQRILVAAAPGLAARRSTAPLWWEWISRWMPIAVPVGIAASLAAGLLVPEAGQVSSPSSYSAEFAADSALVIAAFSDGPVASQWAAHLVAPETGDWLLEEAVTQ